MSTCFTSPKVGQAAAALKFAAELRCENDGCGEGSIIYSYDDVYNLTAMTDRQNAIYGFTYDNNQHQLTAVENAFLYALSGRIPKSIFKESN